MQNIAVAFIVLTCTVYCGWTLMPAAWRRALAKGLLRHRLMSTWSVLILAARPATATAGACGGCDGGGCKSSASAKPNTPSKANPTQSVVHFVARKKR